MCEQNKNINKETEIMKSHQIEILELKSATKIKNSLQEFSKFKQKKESANLKTGQVIQFEDRKEKWKKASRS